jgi:hypothetical protein
MNQGSREPEVNWIEVGRETLELDLRHGRNAFSYAAKLAEEAKRAGDPGAAGPWHAVSASLAPREAGIQR